MKLKRLIGLSAVGLGLLVALVAAIPASRHYILGMLRGEPFAAGRPLGYWIQELKSSKRDDWYRAAKVLATLGPQAEPAVGTVTQALTADPIDKDVHDALVFALERIGPGAIDAVPTLLERASSRWASDNSNIAKAIAARGPKSLSHLLKALVHPNPDVKQDAVAAISILGPEKT